MKPSNASEKEPCVEKREKEKKQYDKCGKTIIGHSG